MHKCLMLGAGHSKVGRRFQTPWSVPEEETEWTTLDYYVDADIKLNLWDVAKVGPELLESFNGLSMPTGFHEIHAYEVLEHFGTQGIPEHFFNTFNWLWELLKPNGFLVGTCPLTTGPWVWGDPGHSRAINRECISFLEEEFYTQCGKTSASDYRPLLNERYWRVLQANDVVEMQGQPVNSFVFALQKLVK